jgi:hypothetical protein
MPRFNLRTTLGLMLAAGVALAPACKPKKTVNLKMTDESGETLWSVVNAADPKASSQLVKGFYDVEGNSWRWTMGKFSVLLRSPVGSRQNGARLVLAYAVPDPVIEKLKSVTLSARIGAIQLAPETVSTPGERQYACDVPASAFADDSVTVEFSLDKWLPPGTVDRRELGVIVTSIGLEGK